MSLGNIILQLGNAYSVIILIYCLLSWVPVQHDGVMGDIKSFFAKISEPYLNLFRKLIPPIGGTVDVTPIIALVVLQLVVSFIARIV